MNEIVAIIMHELLETTTPVEVVIHHMNTLALGH